jgi:cytidine deaminase
MDKETIIKLIDAAKEAANRNYCCNYSKFTVGVALLTASGKVYKGFNVENHGIQSICAERVVFTKALTEGQKEFIAIAVEGKHLGDELFEKTIPCGYCRQFMSEYAKEDFLIYTYDDEEEKLYTYKLKDLLPESFKPHK